MEDEDITIDEMLDNMESNQVSEAKSVECPIDGCTYNNRKIKSVSAHVSSSSRDDHVWTNTEFQGWRHFNRLMQSRVESRVKQARNKDQDENNTDDNDEDKDVVITMDELESEKVDCPHKDCGYQSKKSSSVSSHFNSKSDHSWSETKYDGSKHFNRVNKTIHDEE